MASFLWFGRVPTTRSKKYIDESVRAITHTRRKSHAHILNSFGSCSVAHFGEALIDPVSVSYYMGLVYIPRVLGMVGNQCYVR